MKIPATIDRRFGPRSKEVAERVADAMRKGWRKKILKFLEQEPRCSDCGEKIYHLSYTMLCSPCRSRRNSKRSYEKRKRREKRRNYEDSLRFKLGRLERDARKVINSCVA